MQLGTSPYLEGIQLTKTLVEAMVATLFCN